MAMLTLTFSLGQFPFYGKKKYRLHHKEKMKAGLNTWESKQKCFKPTKNQQVPGNIRFLLCYDAAISRLLPAARDFFFLSEDLAPPSRRLLIPEVQTFSEIPVVLSKIKSLLLNAIGTKNKIHILHLN